MGMSFTYKNRGKLICCKLGVFITPIIFERIEGMIDCHREGRMDFLLQEDGHKKIYSSEFCSSNFL